MLLSEEKSALDFDELKAGDRIVVEHLVTVGVQYWTTRTVGTVVRTERPPPRTALSPQRGRQSL